LHETYREKEEDLLQRDARASGRVDAVRGPVLLAAHHKEEEKEKLRNKRPIRNENRSRKHKIKLEVCFVFVLFLIPFV
jgi:hypothetical protein